MTIVQLPSEGRLFGYVWWCEDDECNCFQARIVRRASYQMPVLFWEGTYRVSGWEEPGELAAEAAATRDLNREARRLRRHEHDLYASIAWPWTK